MGALLLSAESWCTQVLFVPLESGVSVSVSLVEVLSSNPAGLMVRFPGDSQYLSWILRLGSLMWGSESSQQWENFFGIIVLQFVSHPPNGYGI